MVSTRRSCQVASSQQQHKDISDTESQNTGDEGRGMIGGKAGTSSTQINSSEHAAKCDESRHSNNKKKLTKHNMSTSTVIPKAFTLAKSSLKPVGSNCSDEEGSSSEDVDQDIAPLQQRLRENQAEKPESESETTSAALLFHIDTKPSSGTINKSSISHNLQRSKDLSHQKLKASGNVHSSSSEMDDSDDDVVADVDESQSSGEDDVEDNSHHSSTIGEPSIAARMADNTAKDFIIDSNNVSFSKHNAVPHAPKPAAPKTVAELEALILGSDSGDSSDDEEFSFLSKGKHKEKTVENTNTESMFMIDRRAGDDQPDSKTVKSGKADRGTKLDTEITAEYRQKVIQKYGKPASEIQVQPEESYLNLGENAEKNLPKNSYKSKSKPAEPEIMKKAVIGGDFEKRHALPSYTEGKKALARKRMEEKSRVKSGWFDMKAPEMTEELEADIEALQMRGTISSYTGYRKNDYKNGSGPKFFQVATVQDSPLDFYHSRIPKKERKRTIVDELLADAEFRKKNKKMYIKATEKMNQRHPGKKGGRFNKARRTR